MLQRFLLLWLILTIISFIIEGVRCIRKPEGFKYNLFDDDRWLEFNQFVIAITYIIITMIVIVFIGLYIIQGNEFLIKLKSLWI